MPELPEVETVKRGLEKNIVGKTIERLEVRQIKLRWPVDKKLLTMRTKGGTIVKIGRRAKYLCIHLSNDWVVIVHLGMTGNLLIKTQQQAPQKHDHLRFFFTDGVEMRFRDPRKFGMVEIVEATKLETYARFAHLGPEPLADATSAASLYEKASKLKRPIKNLLMDASFLVGVGNIYASEALFYARIHPKTPANKLSKKQWTKLFDEIRAVLQSAIEKGGTTLNDFVDSKGETGYFQLTLAVYGREGEPCPNCQAPIERMVQTGRSSFYCPTCQTQ